MSDIPRLPPEAVKAAAKAAFIPGPWWRDERDVARYNAAMERGILAFLNEIGATVELALMPMEEHPSNPKGWRLVSRWFPIEERNAA